jgi:VanZ family protein
MEAMAVSRLGSLYDRVLRMKSKAREYFKLGIQLAASLHPRTFNAERKIAVLLLCLLRASV